MTRSKPRTQKPTKTTLAPVTGPKSRKCPKCKARVGESCTSLRSTVYSRPMMGFHVERKETKS